MHSTLFDAILAEVRTLITTLDSDGGLITPSLYETAQVVRYFPPTRKADERDMVDWLLCQQQADGGWGDPAAPLYRTAPTVAAVLALHERGQRDQRYQAAIAAGIDAFCHQLTYWQPPLPNDIPVAAELIIPRLLDDAIRAGLPLPTTGLVALRQLGERRRQLISRMPCKAATPPVHAWETWGHRPDRSVIDDSGGVGHSPAATAWWLHMARQRHHLTPLRRHAVAYLAAASKATRCAWPGVVPSPWPLHRFELVFVLHTLRVAGLLQDPRLADVVQPHIQRLAATMDEHGVGFSEFFMPDGDDTAAAVSILATMGHSEFAVALRPFQHADHFRAFPFEMHHAPTVTARGASALAQCGFDNRPWLRTLATCQLPDGRWTGDKWNRSWLYATAVVLDAFTETDDPTPARAALCAILAHQHTDGSWGSTAASSLQETAYAVLALNTLRQIGVWHVGAESSWRRAGSFLLANIKRRNHLPEPLWIDKELYTPVRVDCAFLLSALLLILQSASSPVDIETAGQVYA